MPAGLLAVLLVPLVLGGVSAALTRYRLDEIEPTVRRALTQALVASLVGISFLALARTVNLTSDTSFGAMVAGGALALLLLPVALWLNRVVRRLLYGDREFPRRVVSELRGLDPLAVSRGGTPGDPSTAGSPPPPVVRRDRGLRRDRRRPGPGVDRDAARASRRPSTWWPAGPAWEGWSSRWTPRETRSGRATGGCSRTWAARSVRWSRRCRSTGSCSAPGSTWSRPARRSGDGCATTCTTGLVRLSADPGDAAGCRPRHDRATTPPGRRTSSSALRAGTQEIAEVRRLVDGLRPRRWTSSAWSRRCGTGPTNTTWPRSGTRRGR